MNIIVRTFLRATAKRTPQFRARPPLPQFFGILPLVNNKKFSTDDAKIIEGEVKGFTKQ
jgi:hypothetical protein